jgi:hypothetical protein
LTKALSTPGRANGVTSEILARAQLRKKDVRWADL